MIMYCTVNTLISPIKKGNTLTSHIKKWLKKVLTSDSTRRIKLEEQHCTKNEDLY